MSLLESHNQRTERLFAVARNALLADIVKRGWPEIRRDEYIAWSGGGNHAAKLAVTNCQPLKKAWGKGDERNSKLLSLLFTIPVILRSYRYLPDTKDLGLLERMNLFSTAVDGLFEIELDLPFSAQHVLDKYALLAHQFDSDEDATTGEKELAPIILYSLEMDYVLGTAVTAIGGTCASLPSSLHPSWGTVREFLQFDPVPTPYSKLLQLGNAYPHFTAMAEAMMTGCVLSMTVQRARGGAGVDGALSKALELIKSGTPFDGGDTQQPPKPNVLRQESIPDPSVNAIQDAQKYLDEWRRAEAEFQNYKRRTEQERDENRRFADVAALMNLLPIVDDFDRAFASIDASLAGLTWVDGLRLICRKLVMLLENAGVKPIEANGQPFDPRYHEAVAHIAGEDGKVLSEVQRGYMLHDRVLRPAMVVVGKGTRASGEEGSGQREN